MIKNIITLVMLLPDLLKLIQEMQKAIDEAETDRKVRDDVKTIHEAFKENDSAKLNALFSSK